jgi:hypothetical protein
VYNKICTRLQGSVATLESVNCLDSRTTHKVAASITFCDPQQLDVKFVPDFLVDWDIKLGTHGPRLPIIIKHRGVTPCRVYSGTWWCLLKGRQVLSRNFTWSLVTLRRCLVTKTWDILNSQPSDTDGSYEYTESAMADYQRGVLKRHGGRLWK